MTRLTERDNIIHRLIKQGVQNVTFAHWVPGMQNIGAKTNGRQTVHDQGVYA